MKLIKHIQYGVKMNKILIIIILILLSIIIGLICGFISALKTIKRETKSILDLIKYIDIYELIKRS